VKVINNKNKGNSMGIKSTQNITRQRAISRIKHILSLIQLEDLEELSDELDLNIDYLDMYEVDRMLGNIMDYELFSFSRFENYNVYVDEEYGRVR